MKELSIEEKAKRYDEAKLRMNVAFNSNRCTIGFMNEIFPELKESEDERMMNQLHSWMKEFGGAEEYTEKVFCWLKGLLEKQGEQNPFDYENANIQQKDFPPKVEPNGANGANGQVSLDCEEICDNAWKYLVKRWNEEAEKYHDAWLERVKGAVSEKTKEQKPAWSREDEERLSDAIFFVREYQIPTRDKRLLNAAKETEDWLRTFKDRVFPQPKQEWSEEDEVKINRIVACLENLNVADNDILLEDVNWLKSIKDRVQPKQEWSEEDKTMLCYMEGHLEYLKHDNGYLSNEDQIMLKRQSDWLKSLKDRYTCEPSDEQMNNK